MITYDQIELQNERPLRMCLCVVQNDVDIRKRKLLFVRGSCIPSICEVAEKYYYLKSLQFVQKNIF